MDIFIMPNGPIPDVPMEHVVPWVMSHGEPVHTCGIDEDALGLTNLIGGWGKEGFYVAEYNGVTKAQLQAHVDSINWDRVYDVGTSFDVYAKLVDGYFGMGAGGGENLVTMARYKRLMRHCFKSVSDHRFNQEWRAALRWSKRQTQR